MNLPHPMLSARKRRGLSMPKLSKECGVSERTLWRFERGEGEMGSGSLRSVAVALSVSADELLGLKEAQ